MESNNSTVNCSTTAVTELHTIQVWYIDIGNRNESEEAKVKSEEFYDIQMWIVAIVCKILPCLLLVIMSNLLIHKLRQVGYIKCDILRRLIHFCQHPPSSGQTYPIVDLEYRLLKTL